MENATFTTTIITAYIFNFIVPQEGLEPSRHKTYVPKTYVSTIPPPRHLYHIVQAFYSQLRGIVSNLARLTAVRVPEDMIYCTPDRIRTCDLRFRKPLLYPAELQGQIWYSKRESNPHGRKAHKILSLACLPIPPPEHLIYYGTNISDFV